MSNEPLMYLVAAPIEVADVATLTQASGVRELLERPPHSRGSGFNLLTLDRASLVGGNRLRVSNGDRKHIDLLTDGTLIAIGMFNEFLGWGRRDFLSDPKANGLAVIEFTYDFVLLYESLMRDYIQPTPEHVRFGTGIRHPVYYDEGGNEKRLYLSPGPVRDFDPWDVYERREASTAAFATTIDVDVAPAAPHFDVGRTAYQLVRRVYNWFGHTDDAVPYRAADDEAIDIQQIKDLG